MFPVFNQTSYSSQGFCKPPCGSLSKNQGWSVFNDGFCGRDNPLCVQPFMILALRIDGVNESFKNPLYAILLPRIVASIGNSGLGRFFCSYRLLLDIQHVEFWTNGCAVLVWSNGELPKTRLELEEAFAAIKCRRTR